MQILIKKQPTNVQNYTILNLKQLHKFRNEMKRDSVKIKNRTFEKQHLIIKSKQDNGMLPYIEIPEVMHTETELASYNVSIIIRGHQTFQASVQGIYSVLLAQLNGELQSYPVSNLASTEVMDMAIGKNYFRSLSNKFLG